MLSALIIGAAIAVTFCLWETRGPRIPIMPMRIFKITTVQGVMLLGFLTTGMNVG